MSSLCGILNVDGTPVEKDLLAKMRDIADYRGPDGYGKWTEGKIGMAHRLLITTPESVGERQPLTNGRGLWLAADCRIDNRAELIGEFRSHEKWHRAEEEFSPLPVPDAAFILLAYELWGEGCPRHLLGDFSFALWDSHRKALFCARDLLGMKPFHYFWNGKKFLFGSEIKQIFEDPQIPRTLNEAHLADWILHSFPNREETCYEAIRRLAPGHFLTIAKGRLQISAYDAWDPDSEPLSNASLEENAEKFRALFEEAVRARSRRPPGHHVGSLLSGGLDSSSIAAAAARLERQNAPDADGTLRVFTLVFPEANPRYQYRNADPVDESSYWRPLAEAYGMQSTTVEIRGWGPFQNLREHLWHQDMPLSFPNFAIFQHLFARVRESGVRVLLHGEGGDEIFQPGNQCFADLAGNGACGKFFRELVGRHRNLGVPYPRLLKWAGRALIPEALKIPYRWFWRCFEKSIVPDWIHPSFARRVDLRDRLKRGLAENASLQRSRSYGIHAWLKGGEVSLYLEALDRMAAACQIEIRHPFLDGRLLRFMARVPWDQKTKEGVNKRLLREAVKDLLPPNLSRRVGKAEFTPVIRHALESYAGGEIAQIFERPHPLLEWMVNPVKVRKLYENFFNSPRPSKKLAPSLIHLWYLVAVDQWLKFLENKANKEMGNAIPKTVPSR